MQISTRIGSWFGFYCHIIGILILLERLRTLAASSFLSETEPTHIFPLPLFLISVLLILFYFPFLSLISLTRCLIKRSTDTLYVPLCPVCLNGARWSPIQWHRGGLVSLQASSPGHFLPLRSGNAPGWHGPRISSSIPPLFNRWGASNVGSRNPSASRFFFFSSSSFSPMCVSLWQEKRSLAFGMRDACVAGFVSVQLWWTCCCWWDAGMRGRDLYGKDTGVY